MDLIEVAKALNKTYVFNKAESYKFLDTLDKNLKFNITKENTSLILGTVIPDVIKLLDYTCLTVMDKQTLVIGKVNNSTADNNKFYLLRLA